MFLSFSFRNLLSTTSLLAVLMFSSCVDVEEYDNNAQGNFQALWQVMDEHYCFFPEKETELGVNWNNIRNEYSAQANSSMSRTQLFEFLASMLATLRDGHVNLSSAADFSRNWSWKEDYPVNFSEELLRTYLGKGTEYKIASGMYYRILDDNIGYIYLGSFDNEIGEGNLDEVLSYLAPCNGLILDIRSNGGGQLTEAKKLAARFTDSKVLVGYMRHKTGKGHTDFSDWQETWLETSSRIRWTQKPVCVLSNRSVYSAANEFVKYMKAIGESQGKVTIIGDNTGGGSGLPYSNELPNGWAVRLSACPMYDNHKQCTEFGIAPDIKVDLTTASALQGIDDIIERARKEISIW